MDLAEYLFYETANERKRNGIGDYHKKRRGGRNVRLCSDNLTRKEWEKMNGEVITVNLDQPRTWEEYKELPDNYKKDYMEHLYKKYSATPTMLAEMFGVYRKTVAAEKNRLNLDCPSPKGRVPAEIMKAWNEFLSDMKPQPVPEAPLAGAIVTPDISIKQKQAMVFILRELFGPGVKFTIEIET